MRDDQRFEIERALDLLPHVVGASWTTIWFRLSQNKHPTREEYRNKVIEYLEMLDPLFQSLSGKKGFQEMDEYIQRRKKDEIKKITNGLNEEIEKRYDRYVDYG